MKEKITVASSVVALTALLFAPAADAVNMVDRYKEWVFQAESSQRHPRSRSMTYLVTEPFILTASNIMYSIELGPDYGLGSDEDGSRPLLELPRKIKVTLKITREGENPVSVGTRKSRLNGSCEDRAMAVVMFADPSGADWFESANTDRLPVELERGDLITWTVKFLGGGDLHRFDMIGLKAGYFACGTNDYPCFEGDLALGTTQEN